MAATFAATRGQPDLLLRISPVAASCPAESTKCSRDRRTLSDNSGLYLRFSRANISAIDNLRDVVLRIVHSPTMISVHKSVVDEVFAKHFASLGLEEDTGVRGVGNARVQNLDELKPVKTHKTKARARMELARERCQADKKAAAAKAKNSPGGGSSSGVKADQGGYQEVIEVEEESEPPPDTDSDQESAEAAQLKRDQEEWEQYQEERKQYIAQDRDSFLSSWKAEEAKRIAQDRDILRSWVAEDGPDTDSDQERAVAAELERDQKEREEAKPKEAQKARRISSFLQESDSD